MDHDRKGQSSRSPVARAATRREFLATSALALGAFAVAPVSGAALHRSAPRPGGPIPHDGSAGASSRPGGLGQPGKIVLLRDPEMRGHEATIDRDRVEHNVHQGIRALQGMDDTAAAFEALFPGLTPASRIAIKVNCIGYTDTRWETVRGVVSGLAQMLGGTYDVNRVTIYDNRDFVDRPNNPFAPEEFTFGGRCPVIEDCRWDYHPSYYVYDDHRLYNDPFEADYLINMPALKSHNRELNQLTLACKNHYGSCYPSDMCDDIVGLLTVNADPAIHAKTALVLMDGLRGTYHGPPQQPPQTWLSFPEGAPNTLFFSADPVTNDYWGRSYINAERALRGLEPKPAPWIEQASEPPYEIGISDPDHMGVIYFDPASAPNDPGVQGAPQPPDLLLPARPNPFRDRTAVRLDLPRPAAVTVVLVASSGRLVRTLHQGALDQGLHDLIWDGRDDRGRPLPNGVYWACLRTGVLSRARSLRLLR